MVSPTQGIHKGRNPVFGISAANRLTDHLVVIYRRPCDVADSGKVVTFYVLFQQVPYTTWVLKGFIHLGIAVFVELIEPGFFVVVALLFIETGEQTFVEFKVFPHQIAGVGIGLHIVEVDLVGGDQIADHTQQEGNICT